MKIEYATVEDAKELSSVYNATLGIDGVLSNGCDPWQEEFLFTEKGILNFLRKGQIIVARKEGKIVGSLIRYVEGHHYEESGAIVVDSERDKGIYGKLLAFSENHVGSEYSIMNEPILGSLGAFTTIQKKRFLTGIGVCHYGKVISKDVPESCAYFFKVYSQDSRIIYVPEKYKQITSDICESLGYSVTIQSKGEKDSETTEFTSDLNGVYPNSYVYITHCGSNYGTLISCINEVQQKKDYIEVQVPLQSPTAIALVEELQSHGFFFQSFRPFQNVNGEVRDLLCMQWVQRENTHFYQKYQDLFKEPMHKKIYSFIAGEIDEKET